jgi:hypothetical protein
MDMGGLAIIGDGQQLTAWSFVFATSLLGAFVGASNRRLFSPVHMAMWFFGIAIGAWIGGWGAMTIYTALTCMVGPYAALTLFTGKKRDEGVDSSGDNADAAFGTPRIALTLTDDDVIPFEAEPHPLRRSA